jgi:hypothetical protein
MRDPFAVADEAAVGHRDSPLNPANVNAVFDACLATEGDEHSIDVAGIVGGARFSLVKLIDHRGVIGGMLDQLPDQFKKSGGGGWSFLNACNDRDDRQWTSLHLVMERLFLLGIATGQAEWCLPREMWSAFPGGVPYVVVDV